MAKWTGEVSVMRAGKSYYQNPPTFVTVDAGSYPVAVAKAAREGKRRLAATLGRVVVESVIVKVTRCKVAPDDAKLERAWRASSKVED